jgi:hypothetical protein
MNYFSLQPLIYSKELGVGYYVVTTPLNGNLFEGGEN